MPSIQAVLQQNLLDRRSRVRYPLELPVFYRSLERRRPQAGQGWVMNMSSGGVLVSSPHQIDAGTGLELSIEWPYLLEGRIPLQLVATGKVVRCENSGFALQLTRHQFRTARKTSLKAKPRSVQTHAAGAT
jgi:hypothetical protein